MQIFRAQNKKKNDKKRAAKSDPIDIANSYLIIFYERRSDICKL